MDPNQAQALLRERLPTAVDFSISEEVGRNGGSPRYTLRAWYENVSGGSDERPYVAIGRSVYTVHSDLGLLVEYVIGYVGTWENVPKPERITAVASQTKGN